MNVAVFFGGKTCEHDISIISALQLMDNADSSKYNIVPVYISREGLWYTGEKLRDISFIQNFDPQQVERVYMEPSFGVGMLRRCNVKSGLFSKQSADVCAIDVAIPAIHGMNGEDGTLQGLLELAGIPYASPGVMGSAVGMDKIAMRMMFKGLGYPVLPCLFFSHSQWDGRKQYILDDVEDQIGYPVFVKPANLGSSIGISRADDRDALVKAIEVALSFDNRVMVERGLDCTEINCSAIGYGEDIRTSLCEQPVTWQQLLTFEDKYMSGGKSKGMQSLSRLVPAPISEEATRTIRELTADIYSSLDCHGVIRVDFMIDNKDNALYVNEVNTVPGSFAFYLWEPLGISFAQLIDIMIDSAVRAHQQRNNNQFVFGSKVLNQFGKGAKGTKGK